MVETCEICFDAVTEIVIGRCFHMVCPDCCKKINKCPWCRRADVFINQPITPAAIADVTVRILKLVDQHVCFGALHVREYIRFLQMKINLRDVHSKLLSPSKIIDTIWHLHILDTVNYQSDVQKIAVHFDVPDVVMLHYNPFADPKLKTERLLRTFEIYRQMFGHSPLIYIWKELHDEVNEQRKRSNVYDMMEFMMKTRAIDKKATQIFVKKFFEKEDSILTFHVYLETDTAGDLKKLIAHRTGLEVDKQRVILHGVPLDNDRTLKFCNVQPDSTLFLILNLRGC